MSESPPEPHAAEVITDLCARFYEEWNAEIERTQAAAQLEGGPRAVLDAVRTVDGMNGACLRPAEAEIVAATPGR